MKQPIKTPPAGESVTQATIGQWHKKDGDYVSQNETIVLMETDKASMDMVAEYSGQLSILKSEGEDVKIGEVIGEIDTSIAAPSGVGGESPSSSSKALEEGISASKKDNHRGDSSAQGIEGGVGPVFDRADVSSSALSGVPVPPSPKELLLGLGGRGDKKNPHLSPAIRKLVQEHNLDPELISGSGPRGRITKGDVLEALSHSKGVDTQRVDSVPAGGLAQRDSQGMGAGRYPPRGARQTRERMSLIRRRIAERLVESQASTATLTTFNDVDMSQVIRLRKQYQEMFQKKHGVKLGFMGFFIKAVIYALKKYPKVNAFIEGREIVYNHAYHIGVAVSTDRGLVVPVIRHAESKTLPELEKDILFYAEKAREGKISPDDLVGGTFTISNGGVFGSLMSTPVLNPPQSGILGMHRIEQKPKALDGQVVIRPMMYLALSYDHRMVDGKESVGFLLKVKECIEDPIRLMLDI